MKENTDPSPDPAGSDPDKTSAASPLTREQMEEILGKFVQDKVNEVFHQAYTKRSSTFDKKLSDMSAQIEELAKPKTQEPSELETLQKQMKDLHQKYEAAQETLKDKEITTHISHALSKHNVQMADVAAMVLKPKFIYENGEVFAKDEFGQQIKTDKVIEEFLQSKPGFRPPRNAQGTAERGGGGSRPGLPDHGTSSSDEFSKKDFIDAAGSEEKAKALGWI